MKLNKDWEVDIIKYRGRADLYDVHEIVDVNKSAKAIAFMFNDDEQALNERLICAAPKMYEILAEINAYDFHIENIYERVAKLLAYIDGGKS